MNSADGLTTLDPRRLELLLRLTEADRAARHAAPAGPPAVPGDRPVVLSLAQERLWLAEQMDSGNAAYNIALPLRVTGPLDHAALSAALDRIVERHDALRTTIASVAGRPQGRLREPRTGALRTLDLRGLDTGEREAAVRERIARHVGEPFDLDNGPLHRTELIRTADAEHVLLLSAHHIVADNVSLRIFCAELAMFYGGADAADVPAPLPYARFAARQREGLGTGLDRLEEYWAGQLAGMPRQLDLPFDRPRPPARSFRGAQTPFALPADRAAGFKELQTRHAVTPFMVVMTALFLVLQRHCGQDDIVVGTDVANRNESDLEDVIGFFANQLVIRMRLDDNPTIAEALHRMKLVCLDGYRHQDLPFQHLVGMLGHDRDTSRSPLFQVKLGFLRYGVEELDLPGTEVSLLPAEGTAKFDIEVTCWSTPEGTVDGRFEYATDLFDEGTVKKMSEHLGEAVSAMCEDDTQRVLDVTLNTGRAVAKAAVVPEERFAFE